MQVCWIIQGEPEDVLPSFPRRSIHSVALLSDRWNSRQLERITALLANCLREKASLIFLFAGVEGNGTRAVVQKNGRAVGELEDFSSHSEDVLSTAGVPLLVCGICGDSIADRCGCKASPINGTLVDLGSGIATIEALRAGRSSILISGPELAEDISLLIDEMNAKEPLISLQTSTSFLRGQEITGPLFKEDRP